MPRVAWLCPYVPAPDDSGGRIRIARLARGLSRHAELSLFAHHGIDDDDVERARGGLPFDPWTGVEIVPMRRASGPSVRWEPHATRRLTDELGRRFRVRHGEAPFDAVVASHCYVLARAGPLLGVPLVLDEHNVESAYAARAVAARQRPLLEGAREYAAARWFERQAWRRADAVATVSDDDAREVRDARSGDARPGRGVHVVPNGVDLEHHAFRPPSVRRGAGVLFVGHMAYEPNVQAAELLAREIMPRLRRAVPDARLTLAGRNPSPRVVALEGPSVRVTGALPSVAPLFEEHAAFAMPLSLGSGTSLKALEPLAAGLPLVATAFAVRGYALEPGRHYLRAEGAEATAGALARALTGGADLDPMAERGRAFAEGFGWPAIAARFAELVLGAMAPRRAAR